MHRTTTVATAATTELATNEYRRVVDLFAQLTGIRPGLTGTFAVSSTGGRGHPLTRAIGGQLVEAVARLFILEAE